MNWFTALFPNWDIIASTLPRATLETLLMVGWSTLFVVLIGLPLGLLLNTSAPHGLRPLPGVHQVLSLIVNIGRSLPFVILMVAILPFTRWVVHTSIGWQAAVVPLAVGAIPFYARLVENAAHEVSAGKIEAALMAGASRFQITVGVVVREGLPTLISGLTVTIITLVSYSAMAGFVGAEGLGSLAQNYGYSRYMGDVMLWTAAVTVVIVQLVQVVGDMLARRVNHRR